MSIFEGWNEVLRRWRRDQNWTIERAAKKIGIHPNTLQKYEKGSDPPGLINLEKILLGYRKSLYDLGDALAEQNGHRPWGQTLESAVTFLLNVGTGIERGPEVEERLAEYRRILAEREELGDG